MKNCPKCAGSNISLRFFPKGKTFNYPSSVDLSKNFIKALDNDIYEYPFEIETEHIVYSCSSCGYSVAKDTADAKTLDNSIVNEIDVSKLNEISTLLAEIKDPTFYDTELVHDSIISSIKNSLNIEMSISEVIKYLEEAKIDESESIQNGLNNIIKFLNIETDKDIDERSVDIFSLKMKEKLKRAREKGRGGWYNKELCTDEELANLFKEHLSKANKDNFIDLANFLMFLYIREARDDIFLKDEKLSLLQHIIKNEKSF